MGLYLFNIGLQFIFCKTLKEEMNHPISSELVVLVRKDQGKYSGYLDGPLGG